MGTNISMKEITNFTAHFFIFGCAVNFVFLHGAKQQWGDQSEYFFWNL